MKDILEEILAWKKKEVEMQKAEMPPRTLYAAVEQEMDHLTATRSMRASLLASRSGIIAEFKRKSPSNGWIRESGRPEIIPVGYERAGASALSILTDERYFGGSLRFIETARPLVQAPILRKDFVVDEYQLFQARHAGADAVLLIAAALSPAQCKGLMQMAQQLQLEVLLELHEERELDYAALQPDMLGVNNRHLGSFHTDVQTSFQMASRLPQDALLVSESGISNPATVRTLRQAGFRGFLIGEHFMRAKSPETALKEFIDEVCAD